MTKLERNKIQLYLEKEIQPSCSNDACHDRHQPCYPSLAPLYCYIAIAGDIACGEKSQQSTETNTADVS